MGNRTLRVLLATLVSLALLACTQAEDLASKGGATAQRIGGDTLQVAVSAPKNVTTAPALLAPATQGKAAYQHWTNTYAAVDAAEFVVNKATTANQADIDVSCNRAVKSIAYDANSDGEWQEGEYEVRGVCAAVFATDGTTTPDVIVRRVQNAQYALDATASRGAFLDDGISAPLDATGTQEQPKVAYTPNNPNGGFVVVWTDAQPSPAVDTTKNIKAQRFDKTGARVGAPITVNSYTTNLQQYPDVAMDNNGNFVVAWQSFNQTGDNGYGIFARRFDSDGNPSAEFQVNLSTTADQLYPAVAMHPSGWYAIAWQSTHNSQGNDVYVAKFATDGTRLGSKVAEDCSSCGAGYTCIAGKCWEAFAELAVTASDGEQRAPDIGISETSGNVVLAYEASPVSTGFDIQVSVLDSSLGTITANWPVNKTTAGEQTGPALAVNPDGTFTVVFTGADASGSGVWYRRLAADASDIAGDAADVAVNATTASNQSDVAVAPIRNESSQWAAEAPAPSFLVAYESANQDGNNLGVYARRYGVDDDGDGRGWDGDNCKLVSNLSQADADNDLLGDSCDNCRETTESCTKYGKKTGGVVSSINYCSKVLAGKPATTTENYDQADADSDGIGDVCDNCPNDINATHWPVFAYATDVNDDATQVDYDGDGLGDKCDADDDADGVPDADEDGNDGNDNYDSDFDAATAAELISRHDDDSDGDGIGDFVEYDWLAADCDDTIALYASAAGDHDCDGDGLLNNYDADSDADDIYDDMEGDDDPDNDTIGNWLDGDANGDLVSDFDCVHDVDGTLLDWAVLGGDDYDLDNDTFLDNIDLDMDGDAIATAVEAFHDAACTDADVLCAGAPEDCNDDALFNWQDLDSDGDGIADGTEKVYDGDGADKICAFVDLESDGDGIPDAHESGNDMPAMPGYPAGLADLDADGKINAQDYDADGDGVLDSDEYLDADETDPICNAGGPQNNCDADDYENWVDDDSDGDGISDSHEAGTTKPANVTVDADSDTYRNSMDLDADNDGVVDDVEWDGRVGAGPLAADLDGDTKESWYDDDADGDGELDIVESGTNRPTCPLGTWPTHKGNAGYFVTGACAALDGSQIAQDIDGDETFNSLDFDADADGIVDADENSTDKAGSKDADADGVKNWWDLDSDNDWIADTHESGTEYPYTAHDNLRGCAYAGNFDCSGSDKLLNAFDTDSDNDGIADYTEWLTGCRVVDTTASEKYTFKTLLGGYAVYPATNAGVNCDGDDYENWVDDDSDADGISDSHEAGTDAYGGVALATIVACNAGLGNSSPGGINIAPYLGAAKEDCDNDKFVNSQDLDSDDDGILDDEEYKDATESALICKAAGSQNDCDGDLFENWFDADADGDAIVDSYESGETRPGTLTAILCKTYTFNDTYNNATARDCDGDGILNALDADADGDGIADAEEGTSFDEGTANCVAGAANDSIDPWFDDDTDGDGIWDKVETDNDLPDTATDDAFEAVSDATKNYKDCDSDGDGIADTTERVSVVTGQAADSDNDSNMNFLDADADNDGIADSYECDMGGKGDAGNKVCKTGYAPRGFSLAPKNYDADDLPDYLDLDSDADGIADAHENGDMMPAKLATLEAGTYCMSNGGYTTGTRGTPGNCDGDLLDNYNDTDADGDGIDDAVEWANEAQENADADNNVDRDLDADGLEAWFDNDADGDGIADATEKADTTGSQVTSVAQLDTDVDDLINSLDADADGDSIVDAYECAQGGTASEPAIVPACECDGASCVQHRTVLKPKTLIATATPFDSDADGSEDYIDLNSDCGVGCNALKDPIDEVEAGDALLSTAPNDTDGDTEDDYLDNDADNDGYKDWADNCTTEYNDQADEDTDGLGNVCDPDYHTCDAGVVDVSVTITAPVDFQTGLPDAAEVDGDFVASIPFTFAYTGSAAYGMRVYVDGVIAAVLSPVPASPYSVTVPFGQHRVAFALTNEYGTPYAGCEDARDSVVLRVSKPCTLNEDCDDGNACASHFCNASKKCQFGPSAVAGCCNSDYDCSYQDMCVDKDDDPLTPTVCVGCIPGQAGNCAEQKCKEAVCYSAGDELLVPTHKAFTCGYSEVSTCCSRDSDCAGYPCESCDIDPLTSEGTCTESQFSKDLTAAGQVCCKAKVDTTGDGKVTQADDDGVCEALDGDPCTVKACIGNVCRKGATYFGCCDAHSDCADPAKLNVCNSDGGQAACSGIDPVTHTGTCDYSANDAHPGCCFTNTDCVRALLAGDVADKTYPQYSGDCKGALDAGTGYYANQQPGVDGTMGTADDFYSCTYTANPDVCTVPVGVPAVVVTELMVDPTAASGGAASEWIEIFNPGATPIDLKGWFLNDNDSGANPPTVSDLTVTNIIGWETNDYACTSDAICAAHSGAYPTCQSSKCWGLQSKIVNPGKSFVVCRDAAARTAGVPCSYVMSTTTGTWSLGNSGDGVALFTPDSDGQVGKVNGTLGNGLGEPELIDFVIYTAAKVATGYSLAIDHPYAASLPGYVKNDVHWLGQGTNARLKYNADNYGTPLKINNDVFEKALIDDASASFIATCNDKGGAKDCTIGICNLNAANFCGYVQLSGCCDASRAVTNDHACASDTDCAGQAAYSVCDTVRGKCVLATSLSQQCSDGNACTTDTCSQTTLTCNNSTPDPSCCSTDAQCAGYYPDTLVLNLDVVAPAGIDGLDEAAIKASFDEIVNKKCVAHKCRYRKSPSALGGCITTTYGLAAFACDDKNACTKNQCLCSTGSDGDCRNGSATDGYYKCDYATPVTAGQDCCYDNTDCVDDDAILDGGSPKTCNKDSDCGAKPAHCSIAGVCYDGVDNDPSTIESCANYTCSSKAKDGYCTADAQCVSGTACQVGTCNVATNTCAYAADPTKAGCCAANADCIAEEIAANGVNLAYTIDVCCDSKTNALGTNTTLDALCSTATMPAGWSPVANTSGVCVHATGEGYCDNAADCTADVGKRCLTAYCVAHRCRFGLPELDGNPGTAGTQECCDPTRPLVGGVNPDCQDNDACTVDACVETVGGLGYCTHTADALGKPGCCTTTADCEASTTACVTTSCQYDSVAGYKKCTDIDLSAPNGPCCTHPTGVADAACDDGNACTTDLCDTDATCRHVKPVPECCTQKSECPPTGDACAVKDCQSAACTLTTTANCIANLPYQQDFEFPQEYYDAAFDAVTVIGWATSGQSQASWNPSADDAKVFGADHSKHLRFEPAADTALDTGACVVLPKLNTMGQSLAGGVVAFYYALDVAAGQGDVTVSTQAFNKKTSAWDKLWTKTTAADVLESDVYAVIPATSTTKQYLGGQDTQIRFCVESASFKVGGYLTIDDVKVVRGALPTLVTTISDKVVAKGADLLVNDIDAYDTDSDTVSYSLVGAPAFVKLADFHTGSVSSVTHTYVDIQVTDAECEGVGGDNVYPIVLKISDGFVNVYETFNLTVTGCTGL